MLLNRRVYYLVCDRCGANGPSGHDPYDARAAAAEEGWRSATRWTGLEYARRDLCPSCAEEEKTTS